MFDIWYDVWKTASTSITPWKCFLCFQGFSLLEFTTYNTQLKFRTGLFLFNASKYIIDAGQTCTINTKGLLQFVSCDIATLRYCDKSSLSLEPSVAFNESHFSKTIYTDRYSDMEIALALMLPNHDVPQVKISLYPKGQSAQQRFVDPTIL